MDKLTRYSNLVAKFKTYKFKNPDELINPHELVEEGFNFDVINPWELWYNDLDAEIMFIGQDFSDTASLKENLSNGWMKEKNSPTNKTIIEFFKIIGPDLKEVDYTPDTNKDKLFFTNAILGIKQSETANMSKSVKNDWYKETLEYLKELIDIVEPKYIIVMGKIAYLALCSIYKITPKVKITDAIGELIEPQIDKNKKVFVIQHFSPRSRKYRLVVQQRDDWEKIKGKIHLDLPSLTN